MKKILVIGSLNMDIVTKVNKTPKVGETVSGMGLVNNPGGKGANQGVALGKLGADVTMIGKVGSDSYGEKLKRNLQDMNVIDKVEVVSGVSTGTAFIMLNEDGDNSIVVIEGANGELLPNEVNESWFDDIDFVVTQNEIREETVYKILEMAKKLEKTTFLNLAPARKIEDKYLKMIDYLIVNETEFEVVSDIPYNEESDLKKGFEKLGVGNIIITLGGNGAKYYNGVDLVSVKAEKVKVVDTTAGGDSFIGGFIYALAKSETIKNSMEFATKVAGYTVTKFGAQNALPYLKDIK